MTRQQAEHGNVLVDIEPVDALAAADQALIGALGGAGVAQAGKPFDRHREFTAIIENDAQDRGGDGDVNGQGFSL